MDGSIDVRKFLWNDNDGFTRSAGGVPAPRNGESVRVSSEKVHSARVAVARGAKDAEDCKLLLDMLGLTPDENGDPPVTR